MNFSLREITSAFIVMFAVIDITGSTPIILDLKSRGKKIEPLSASLGSFGLFMAFMFGGQWMLNLFGVSIQAFAVAGSLILFVMSLEMILGIEIFKYNDSPSGSATVVPIIFPLIAGAAALTTMLSIRSEYHLENIIVAIALNMVLCYFVLRHLGWMEKVFGKSTIYVMRKFFGIILLAMSVRLFAVNVVTLFK